VLEPWRVSVPCAKVLKRDNLSYCGQLNETGEYHGYGTLYDEQKLKYYEGSFKDGLKHGRGRSYVI